ncbi:RIP metalloprotease RseP [Faecalibacterium sp. An58]|uniref:M50 family metallopeptidase n=1 Tax=Faecalibacterium sp. An58 TaxID=1965648 RepID=UPI000B3A5A07|nr:M50 family metallopeptidase [Faecalibacterium sp. An58]OUN75008.1 RIP metalloprotease RseP [Faecalibacterium sp. An58]
MTILITFLASLLVFGAVIAIHEFGHFAAAKLSGIQVNEFSIGMGPALLKKIAGGTQYTLRLLPIGGYVAMEGEGSPESEQAQRERDAREDDGDQEDACLNPIPPEQRTGIPFPEAAVWKRAIVMAAGPLMNFVLGFAVLLGLIAFRSDPIASRVIYRIEEGALCGQTGLQPGDEILAVNGRRCFIANDIVYELVRTRNTQADFTVLRDGRRVELPGVRFDTYQDEAGGTHMDIGFVVYALEKTPANVLKESLNSELYYGRIIFTTLVDLLRGRESINNLSGPVGIVSAISQAASYGLTDLLEMLVLITVNVGVFNLLPIPALDGGRLVFLAAEAVIRRPVSQRLQEGLTVATFILLFGLMIFATYNDVIRLFTGGF